MYLTGHVRWLMHTVGPRLSRLGDVRSSVALGLLFGLNIPSCAAPLLVALLAATATGATPGGVAGGFISLSIFGLALSLPLVAAVLFGPARRALDWIAGLSGRIPRWTGADDCARCRDDLVRPVGEAWVGLDSAPRCRG